MNKFGFTNWFRDWDFYEWMMATMTVLAVVLFLGSLVQIIRLDRLERTADVAWQQQTPDVSEARKLLSECVDDLNGVATVKTHWHEQRPTGWEIKCEYGW